MKVQPYGPEFAQVWNQFCDVQENAWFWHTTGWMEYCLDCRFGVQSENMSFLLFDDDGHTVLAIAPLMKETLFNTSEFTYGGAPTPAPVVNSSQGEKKKSQVKQFLFEYYRKLAEQNQVKRIVVRQANVKMAGHQSPGPNFEPIFVKYGFIELPSYTSVLTVQKDEDILYKEMHDNHKWEIRKALRSKAVVNVYSRETISRETMDAFVHAYFQAAGRVTRPAATFEKWYQIILGGNGFLFELTLAEEIMGYVYILLYKKYAYYCMGCNLNNRVIGSHLIHWEIIKFLKNRQADFYELGEQFYVPSLYCPTSQKNWTISRFKRHFGGLLVPQSTAEYFYSMDYFNEVWSERITRYAHDMETV